MKAITTIYKGRRFRSRLEARWAIFFDAIDIGWEYETEGFEIGNTKYLTDFKLLSFGEDEVDLYIEIKPRRPSLDEIRKCYEVACGTGIDMLLLCGTPGLPEFSSLGENWNLKTGYIALHFPSSVSMKGKEDCPMPFDLWMESARFGIFQTCLEGKSLDVWSIYWDIERIDNNNLNCQIISKVKGITENIFGINPYGNIIPTMYFVPKKTDGRTLVHERLIYGYEVATCARFEHDEFNLTIVDGFYRELELIPFKHVYSSNDNAYSLYYNSSEKKFISKNYNEEKPQNTITLVKKCPKLIIKQFVINYPIQNRSENNFEILDVWKGFLFRYRITLKDLKLKRKIK